MPHHSSSPYSIHTPSPIESCLLQDCIPWFPIQSIHTVFEAAAFGIHVAVFIHLRQQATHPASLILPIPIPWSALVHTFELHTSPLVSQAASIIPTQRTPAILQDPTAPFLLFQDATLGHIACIPALLPQTSLTLLVRYFLPTMHFGSWQGLQLPIHIAPPPPPTPAQPPHHRPVGQFEDILDHLTHARRVPCSHPLLPRHKIQGLFRHGIAQPESFQSTTHSVTIHVESTRTLLQVTEASPHPSFVLSWQPASPRTNSGKVYVSRKSGASRCYAYVVPPHHHPTCLPCPSDPFQALPWNVILDIPQPIAATSRSRLSLALSLLSCLSHEPFMTTDECSRLLVWKSSPPRNSLWPSWIHHVAHLTPDSVLPDLPFIWITDGTAWDARTHLARQTAAQALPIHLVLLQRPHDEARLRECIIRTRGTWFDLHGCGESSHAGRTIAAWIQCLLQTHDWRTEPILAPSPDLRLGLGSQQPRLFSDSLNLLPRFLVPNSLPDAEPRWVNVSDFLELKSRWLMRLDALSRVRWAEAQGSLPADRDARLAQTRGFLALHTCFLGSRPGAKAIPHAPVLCQPWTLA